MASQRERVTSKKKRQDKPKCHVTLKVFLQTEKKDGQGKITGYDWIERKKGDKVKKKQLIKVTAEGCLAKMTITADEPGTVTLSNTPPTPDEETCTKYKEVIYWATEIGKEVDDPPAKPEVLFVAKSKCGPCGDCKGNDSDSGRVAFQPA